MTALTSRWKRYAATPRRYRLGAVSVLRPHYWQLPNANYLGTRHESFSKCLRRSVEGAPSVLHAHYAYPCGLAAASTGRGWGVPVVLTLHGSDVNVYPERSALLRRYFARAVQEANFVTAVSHALADRTEELAGKRPEVIPIGIDRRPYESLPDRAAARQMLGLPPEKKIVLFVGAIVEGKGVRILSEAVQRLGRSDVLAVLVGDGPLRAEMSASAAIRCVGAVPHDQIPLYMRSADVLALPSYSEGMPTVLVEAGAAELPVVATDVGGIGELLGKDRGVLVPAGDAESLAAALESALADPGPAAERAARLRDHVAKEYDSDANARRMRGIYEGLL
jgi:teichuronic acid biosynthesis glycosyltransferase TuaC